VRGAFDLSVYLVTDRPLCAGRDLVEVVRAALAGGASIIQLREKHADTREFVELARAMRAVCDEYDAPLLINDRVDVALACGAAGVHVGQSDMAPADVRAIVGPDAIVGLSTDTPEQVVAAQSLDIDYIGIGPVYATATKADAGEALGLAGFRRALELSRLPVVAIGAVTAATTAELIRVGAAGVAVVSAICAAESPEAATRELAQAVEQGRS
jgi:thiamine-phosphate pyrophosphorylase